jgi:integrase
MAAFSSDDPDAVSKMRTMFGPGDVDVQIRQAIRLCWMVLAAKKKTVDELEKQFRRLVERAINDVRKDSDAFGLGKWHLRRPRLPGPPIIQLALIRRPQLNVRSALRHRFGTEALRAGLPLKDVAELMGHVSVTTTEIYLHRDVTELASGQDRLPPVWDGESPAAAG